MKNGKDKGLGEEPNIIRPNFGATKSKDTILSRQVSDNIRTVTDLIHEDLARPAELSGSSIPPRSTEANAQVKKFRRANRSSRTVFSGKRKKTGITREGLNFNNWLMREKTIESITGGTRQQVSTKNMAEEDKRAEEQGYGGVRKVYRLIQNTIPQAEEPADYDQHASQIAEKIKNAVQELENFYNFRDEDDEPIFTDNPKDPRLFNAVASILVRVWGHNYLNKLNDVRVNSMVLLLNRGDVSWRKLIDLMVEWEKSPSVARTVNRYNR